MPKGNNGFFYQAGSVSFVPTELFKQPNKWLSYAKIRANIGTTGKDAGTYLLNSVFVVNPAISTNDGGFVLAGSFKSTAANLDIFLLKVNELGDPVWFKTFGGSGDETPVAIREDENGNLLVCGTNELGNYATVFLMKTDRNGELKN